MNLLRDLASQELPVEISDAGHVDAVRILIAAGLVVAMVPRPVRTKNRFEQPPATVTKVTRLGKQMLQRFPRRDERTS
ncbi:hypothetical protein [Variovorax soli]|uniref:Uncharacterized protein n=1 Tax=Variovorax soli TaxID=376815 RepID=A0ABU1NF79_9BURK|nr:hypothetical protein [Variovorax soli]MDR6536696.1 hypothetical protein [Variovorax soli]